jgi:hypothetical protein
LEIHLCVFSVFPVDKVHLVQKRQGKMPSLKVNTDDVLSSVSKDVDFIYVTQNVTRSSG